MMFLSKFCSHLWKRCFLFIALGLGLFAFIPDAARAQATPEQKQAILKLFDEAQKSTDPHVGTEMIEKAIKAALESNDKRLAGALENNWGNFLAARSRMGEALPYAQNGLALFRELRMDYECSYLEALLFEIYRGLGDYKKAIQVGDMGLEDALKGKVEYPFIRLMLGQLEILESIRQRTVPVDRRPYEHYLMIAEKIGAKIEAAILQIDIAHCAFVASNLSESINLNESAFLILKSDGANYSQTVAVKAATEIGGIYLTWGLWQEALAWFEEAKPIIGRLALAGDGNVALLRVGTVGGMGIAHYWMQRYDAARSELEEAISWGKKTTVPSKVYPFEALLASMQPNDHKKSLDPAVLIQDATRILTEQSPLNEELWRLSQQLMLTGWTLYYQDQFPQALKTLKLAQQTWERTNDAALPGDYGIAILTGLGIIETELKHDSEAAKYLQQAITLQEALSHSIPSPQQRAQQFALNVAAYRALARLRHQQGRREEALLLLERGHVQGIAAQYTRLAALRALPPSDQSEFLKISQALLKTKTPATAAILAYNQEEEQLRKSGNLPEFSPLLLERNDIHLLTQRHPDTLFLEWSLLDDHTVLLIAFGSQDKIWSSEWKVPRNSLGINRSEPLKSEVAARWLQALPSGYDNEPQLAGRLYSLLFAPLETRTNMLKSGRYRRLALVTDGEMANLPFAALQDTKGKRLFERYTISVHFSLKLLAKSLTFPKSGTKTLIVADPSPDTQPLPIAHNYAQRVARILPNTQFLTGKDAIQSAVFTAMKKAMLIVFATHGEGKGSSPSLLLAADPKGNDSGRLDAWQVALTPLQARLAVLWGCQTGLGKPFGTEGLVGFVWAFHAAGCPAVVCSQWQVDEASGSELMEQFHIELSHGLAADEALARAMRTMQKKYPRPKDWAPFQLYGSTPSLFAVHS